MFRQMKNIDSSFRYIRLFSIVLVLSCVIITLYALHYSSKSIKQAHQKIFILANGKVLEAFAADRKDNIQVEARDHVKMFHTYFFTLDPDDKVIQENISKALYLADHSAKQQYDNLKENNYYSNIISGNISQTILVDSILIDMDQYPFYFRFTGRQNIIRPTSIVTRNLITEGYLRNVSRSDNNAHGFLIEKWKTINNKDIDVKQR